MNRHRWLECRGCFYPLLALVPVGLVVATLVFGILLSIFNAKQTDGWIAPLLSFAVATVLPIVPLLAIVPYLRRRVGGMARALDPAFAFLRPTPEQGSLATRGWHTLFGDRRLDAWYTRGPNFQIYLDANAQCRAIFHRAQPERSRFSRLLSRHPIVIGDGPLAGSTFDTTDFPWCHRLLDDPEAVRAIQSLLAEGDPAPLVHIKPNALYWVRRDLAQSELHESNVREWLGNLQTLARAVDRLGPSDTNQRPSRLERWARRHRGRTSRWALISLLGCLPIILVAATLVFTAMGFLVYSAAV